MKTLLPTSLLLCSMLGLAGTSHAAPVTAGKPPVQAGSTTPTPQIDMRAVVDRVMQRHTSATNPYVGVSIVVIKDGVRHQYHYGEAVAGKGTRPNGDTYYAIGSVTKTFTGTLLALFDIKKYVDMDDLLSAHIGNGVQLSGGRQHITLRHLGLHRSGLPKNPPGGANGYEKGDYESDMAALRKSVGDCTATTCVEPIDDDEDSIYSNWGFALLADILADAKDSRIAGAFGTHLWSPIGMNDTGYKYSLRDTSCLAPGTTCNYDDYGNCTYVAACNDTFHRRAAVGYKIVNGTPVRGGGEKGTGSNDYIKSGSGTVWSTPNDMTKWLAYHMDADGDQAPATRIVTAAARVSRTDDGSNFLGKYQTTDEGHRYLRKVGSIPDQFATFFGFTDDRKLGVLVFSNQEHLGVTSIGEDLIDALR